MDILTVKMNGNDFGILLDDVVFIVGKAENVKIIPNAHANIRGITKVSGDDVSVYNLASRLGYAEFKVADIVVVNSNGIKIGLEVGAASTIAHVDDSKVFSVPPVMNGRSSDFKCIASLKDRKLVSIIDVDRLLSQEERTYIRRMLEENAKESAPAEAVTPEEATNSAEESNPTEEIIPAEDSNAAEESLSS